MGLYTFLIASPSVAADTRLRLAVIVHPARSVALTKAEVAQIYMRQRRYWPDGKPIIAINREVSSKVRAALSEDVLGDRRHRLTMYWNQMYFMGILPPRVLASTAAVKRFVATETNAIGYIEADQVDKSVHVALLLE